jgi:hypothetical protein
MADYSEDYTIPELIFVPDFRTGTFSLKNTYRYGMFLNNGLAK